MGATSFRDLGPGLHVLREVDPEQRAATLAAELGAELCATTSQVDRVLAARSQLPTLDPASLAGLAGLARRLERTHGMVHRTRQRAEAAAGARLSAAGGLAIHPDTVRERAARVDRARQELLAAEQAMADHDATEEPVEVIEPGEPAGSPAPGEASSAPASTVLRGQRNRALGALLAAFGLGLILLALDVVPLWAALVPPLVAALWAQRALRPAPPDAAHSEASRLLFDVGAFTDARHGTQRRSREQEAEVARLAAARSRAEEELLVAERAWRDLAGDDADPTDVEAVVRRFDPQHEEAALIAAESVGVRAVEAARQQLVDHWIETWAVLGRDAPPADGAEAAVAALDAEVGRAVVLVGEAADRGAEVVRVAPAAPVVVLVGPGGLTAQMRPGGAGVS